jgi:hypothetical protein
MAKGQFDNGYGNSPQRKTPPRSDKNSSYLNKNTFPAIAIALSFIAGTVASIFGWALADDASWGPLLVGCVITFAIIYYLIMFIVSWVRKMFGGGNDAPKKTATQIKLDNVHSDDGWGD